MSLGEIEANRRREYLATVESQLREADAMKVLMDKAGARIKEIIVLKKEM